MNDQFNVVEAAKNLYEDLKKYIPKGKKKAIFAVPKGENIYDDYVDKMPPIPEKMDVEYGLAVDFQISMRLLRKGHNSPEGEIPNSLNEVERLINQEGSCTKAVRERIGDIQFVNQCSGHLCCITWVKQVLSSIANDSVVSKFTRHYNYYVAYQYIMAAGILAWRIYKEIRDDYLSQTRPIIRYITETPSLCQNIITQYFEENKLDPKVFEILREQMQSNHAACMGAIEKTQSLANDAREEAAGANSNAQWLRREREQTRAKNQARGVENQRKGAADEEKVRAKRDKEAALRRVHNDPEVKAGKRGAIARACRRVCLQFCPKSSRKDALGKCRDGYYKLQNERGEDYAPQSLERAYRKKYNVNKTC